MGKPKEKRQALEQAEIQTDLGTEVLRERIKNWLRETVTLMVDYADDVKVIDGRLRGNDTQLKILVHTDDAGKVIGKEGRHARSLRTVLMAISRAHGHNFTLDVVDTNEDKRAARA
jgi:predicted RNA-binding protein YlqC (UPF0109 family)